MRKREITAISKLTYETAQATVKQDVASVAAKAALETARINLSYTEVVSPIKDAAPGIRLPGGSKPSFKLQPSQ